MHDQPCKHIRGSANNKDNIITCSLIACFLEILQEITNEQRKENSTCSSSHSPDANYGANHSFREHIRSSSINISTPGLVSCGGQADQRNDQPHGMCISCKY